MTIETDATAYCDCCEKEYHVRLGGAKPESPEWYDEWMPKQGWIKVEAYKNYDKHYCPDCQEKIVNAMRSIEKDKKEKN